MLLRRIARPLLAGMFISGGVAALRDPKGHEQAARLMLEQVRQVVPVENPPSHLTLVRLDAGIKIGAGALLAMGALPRFAAAVLAADLIPTTLAGHRFWEIDDPGQRQAEQIQFVKNLGILGGLLLATADTEGKPSLGWWARRRARMAARAGSQLANAATRASGRTTGVVEHAVGRASGVMKQTPVVVGEASGRLTGVAGQTVGRLRGRAGKAALPASAAVIPAAGRLARRASVRGAGKRKRGAGDRTAEGITLLGARTTDVAGRAGERATAIVGKAGERATEVVGRAGERLVDQSARLHAEAEKLTRQTAKHARRRRAGKRVARASRQASRRVRRMRASLGT